MKRPARICVLLAFAASLVASPSSAQDANSVQVGGRFYQKKTTYDFDSDTISGDLTKPDGEYIEARKNAKLERLIILRPHFRERILQSIDEL